jgi:predicted nucleic acid-binding protein
MAVPGNRWKHVEPQDTLTALWRFPPLERPADDKLQTTQLGEPAPLPLLVLDAGILGLLAHPNGSNETCGCRRWLADRVRTGARVVVPEIADYEVRRELIRAEKSAGLRSLDELGAQLEYLPLTTESMRVAAQLWAAARRMGRPTASDAALDGDMILAAQARTFGEKHGLPVVVITTNVAHLTRFVKAAAWPEA